MERRQFIQSSSMLLAALPFTGRFPAHLLNDELNTYQFNIGHIRCTLFRDFMFKYLAKDFFINATEPELGQLLQKYHASADNILSPFVALLLEYDNKKVLIDTGVGYSEKPLTVGERTVFFKGSLLERLQKHGIKRGQITDVILTHFHPDHIGGIFDDNAQLVYPNARFIAHADEWNYWNSAEGLNQSAQFKYFIEKNIIGLKSHDLTLINGESPEILPGVTAIKTGGHTPGHIAVLVQSKKEKLLYWSDAFLHPGHIEHLDWQTSYDMDHDKAKESRMKLLNLANKEEMLVSSFHFDFPGLGRVERNKEKWIWRYQMTKAK